MMSRRVTPVNHHQAKVYCKENEHTRGGNTRWQEVDTMQLSADSHMDKEITCAHARKHMDRTNSQLTTICETRQAIHKSQNSVIRKLKRQFDFYNPYKCINALRFRLLTQNTEKRWAKKQIMNRKTTEMRKRFECKHASSLKLW